MARLPLVATLFAAALCSAAQARENVMRVLDASSSDEDTLRSYLSSDGH